MSSFQNHVLRTSVLVAIKCTCAFGPCLRGHAPALATAKAMITKMVQICDARWKRTKPLFAPPSVMAASHSTSPAPAGLALASTLTRFERYLFARRGLSQVTVHDYVSVVRRLAPLLGLAPTVGAIERHIEQMHKAGASYSHIQNPDNRPKNHEKTPPKCSKPK